MKNVPVITVVVVLFALAFWKGCSDYNMGSEIASWKSLYESEHKQAEIWRNKDSTSQASLSDAMVSIETLKSVHHKELDAANKKIKGLEKNLSNLQSFTTIGTSTSGTVIARIDTVYVDSAGVTIEKPGFAYKDEWVTLSGYFLRENSADNAVSVDYKIRDSISVTQYWVRPSGLFGFIKPRILKTDVISENPNSTIKTLRSISIAEKPRRFSLVAVGGYGLSAGGAGPFIGLGLGYSLIKF